jgi:hypothetical protein
VSKVLGDAPSLRSPVDADGPRYAPGEVEERVIDCPECNGDGGFERLTGGYNHHDGSPYTVWDECRACNGQCEVTVITKPVEFADLPEVGGPYCALGEEQCVCWFDQPICTNWREGLSPRVAGEQTPETARKDGAAPLPNQPRDGTS